MKKNPLEATTTTATTTTTTATATATTTTATTTTATTKIGADSNAGEAAVVIGGQRGGGLDFGNEI